MYKRYGLLLVAGAAIFALDASAASAQTPPRSQKRIPIAKEAPGEVAQPRVDTVTVYKTDTLRLRGRPDTVRMTNTVIHTDTVIQQVQLTAKHIGGMYFGVAAGGVLPYGAIRTVNEPGALGQVQLGWQGLNNPLGIRLDGSYTQFSDNADYAVLGDRPSMLTGNLDLRLNLPFFNHTLGSSVLFTPYALGGGSMVRYDNLRMKLNSDEGVVGGFGPQHAVIAGSAGTATTGTTIQNTDWHNDFGWNVGGGFAFHAGKKEMFIEARAIHFNRDDTRYHASWAIPITFGVNFF